MSVPDAGLTEWLNRMCGLSTNGTLYVGVGTGTNAEAAADTALQTELVRVALSTKTVSGSTMTLKSFFNTAQANGALAETGILDAAAAGHLLDRSAVAPAQTKAATQELIVEYALSLARG